MYHSLYFFAFQLIFFNTNLNISGILSSLLFSFLLSIENCFQVGFRLLSITSVLYTKGPKAPFVIRLISKRGSLLLKKSLLSRFFAENWNVYIWLLPAPTSCEKIFIEPLRSFRVLLNPRDWFETISPWKNFLFNSSKSKAPAPQKYGKFKRRR